MYEALMFGDDTLLLFNDAILLREQEFFLGVATLQIVELLDHVHLLLLKQAHDLLTVFLEELDLGLSSVLFESYEFDLVLLL